MCKTMGVPAAACEPAGPFPAQLCSDIAAYDRAFNGGAPSPPPTTNEAVNEKLYTFFNGAFNTMTRGTWTGSEVDNYGDPASTGSGTSTVSTSRWAPGLVGLLVSETADATNSSNCSLLLGGEDVVRLGDDLELLLRMLVARVLVGVPLRTEARRRVSKNNKYTMASAGCTFSAA